ncbi:trypco2 family protein [Amycolatopsis sp. NPDC051758]|uniref:trypco2 family protein n=1 Tax=Amycolatopsis sp. NPDC051758 TaxID=3363935 RepID=UPI0037937E6F
MTDSDDSGQVLLDQDGVALSTAIELLRAELTEALDAGVDQRVKFIPESIELELELAVKATRKADGKVSLWKVVSFGGAKEFEASARHRLKLVLKPQDTTAPVGGETLIGDDE